MAYTTVNKAKDHFNSLTYTGNGASPRSITGVGFRPDFVWTKDRSDSSTQPWHDVVRGATYAIRSDSNAANENTPSGTLNKPEPIPAAPAIYQAVSLPSSSEINGTNSAI